MRKIELNQFVHDIATPLTMVKLNLEQLTGEVEWKSGQIRQKKIINRIQSGIEELDHLVSMHSRLKSPIIFRTTVIKEIRKVVLLFEATLMRNKIKLELIFEEDYFLVNASDKFHRIMLNLMCNAIEALEKVKGRAKSIVIKTGRLETGFVLTIADNGAGIKPAHLPHIFNYRFTTKPLGNGLGLYNVKSLLLEYFNGFITCNSKEGEGTEFEIILPD
jgi:signal transduction histidine kinase